ncbi:MAG TPA: 1-aminocyclopropane-1-carboxylate deaminase/D-cysteine desulfhydrase [Sulfurovum sp.]|uniref:1-aminocyclopropane-1-carboxylate deaminase/D-cysteine desulfhydrase n=1 Tax=Sulfurovum sp. TaxID=1969726 RepID=UPI002F95008A
MKTFDLPSPIQSITVEEQHFYLKRDDLIDPDFSGNKARKFYYFLQNEFPDVHKLISYGSSQSNAMYSLSVLAKMKGWEFEYRVDHIAEHLKTHPHGNYKAALEHGMQIAEKRWSEAEEHPRGVLFIEEGGRAKEAEYGVKILAEEILQWKEEHGLEALNVFLPSGTGTTALFLQKHLLPDHVYTTPCVGDAHYLKTQFSALEKNEKLHPVIVSPEKKYHFGKLYKENYKIWLKLQQQTGVEFDLLYDPIGWRVLLAHPEIFSTPTLYIHQGGLLGNESMLPRYQRKYG